MYAVSNDYLTAASQPATVHSLRGTVGGESITGANVLAGSLTITNQITDSSGFSLGAVYIGQLTATFVGLALAKSAYMGASIILEAGLTLADNSIEWVPLGTFTIAEASWDTLGVTVRAYDNMSLFDTAFTLTATTPYAILSEACTACGVTLATSQANIEALANGTETLTLAQENDCSTWRDILSWLMVTLSAYATIDRSGQLVVNAFGTSATHTLTEYTRVRDASFGDTSITFSGVTVETDDGEETVTNGGTGYVLSLGKNPFMQNPVDRTTLANNVLSSLSTITYTPCTVETPVGEFLDLGDVLSLTGGRGNATDLFPVMSITWKPNQPTKIVGMPKPGRAASRADKRAQSLTSMISMNAAASLLPDILAEDDINDGDNADIATWAFETTGNGFVSAHLMVNFYISATVSCEVTITWDLDGATVETQTATYTEGNHILTLDYLLTGLTEGYHILALNLAPVGGDIQ